MADVVGEQDLRAEHIEKIVKGFALQEYRMKELVMINSSNAWQESYYQETATDLTAKGNRAVKGVPRLAQFPHGEVSWTKKSSYMIKHGMEGQISWEDAITNNIDVVARTLLRIARAVAKSVDQEIYNAVTENDTPATIQTVAITAGNEWDSATVANRDPVKDILLAKSKMYEQNYNPDNGMGYIVFSPKDYANCLSNAKFAHFFQEEIGTNGKVGRLLGLNVIVSNSVTADKCLVAIAKECATWKSAIPLTVSTIQDPGVKWTIRAYELGVTQLINPNAVCLITNTQA